jgi:hypothetical protein
MVRRTGCTFVCCSAYGIIGCDVAKQSDTGSRKVCSEVGLLLGTMALSRVRVAWTASGYDLPVLSYHQPSWNKMILSFIHTSPRLVTLLNRINPALHLTNFPLCLDLSNRFLILIVIIIPLHLLLFIFFISSSSSLSAFSSFSIYPPLPSQLYHTSNFNKYFSETASSPMHSKCIFHLFLL